MLLYSRLVAAVALLSADLVLANPMPVKGEGEHKDHTSKVAKGPYMAFVDTELPGNEGELLPPVLNNARVVLSQTARYDTIRVATFNHWTSNANENVMWPVLDFESGKALRAEIQGPLTLYAGFDSQGAKHDAYMPILFAPRKNLQDGARMVYSGSETINGKEIKFQIEKSFETLDDLDSKEDLAAVFMRNTNERFAICPNPYDDSPWSFHVLSFVKKGVDMRKVGCIPVNLFVKDSDVRDPYAG